MSEFDAIDEDFEAWAEDYGDAELDEADVEAVPDRQARGRPPIRRAQTQSNAATGVQGRQFGVVRTPQGDARIELPAKFPTVDEFKESITKLQSDIKANSTGIGQLTTRLKGDTQLEATTRTKHVRYVRRSMRRLQWATFFALTVPLLMEATRPKKSRAFAHDPTL
jgi:hypothetical protein